MPNLDELPEEPPMIPPETPEEKRERLKQNRLANLARGRERARQARQQAPSGGSGKSSSGPPKATNPYRQIHDTFEELAGTAGTGLLAVSPLVGAYLGGSTERTAPSRQPKTPEQRAEYVGNLMARAAEEAPPFFKVLQILLHYGIWAELAVFLLDLGLAAGLDQQVFPADSWLALLARRRLRDVAATLNEEAQRATSTGSAVPSNGTGAPLRWQPSVSPASSLG